MSNTDNIYNGIFYCAQSAVSELVFECAAISGAEFSACYRFGSCWMKTKFVDNVGDIPNETQYLLARHGSGYTLYFMLCDGNARASLFGKDGKVFCRVETGDENVPLGEFRYMYALNCKDPYDGIELAYNELNDAIRSFKLKKDKKQPSFIDRFGYCTYNAFYSEVTKDNILNVEKTFNENGVQLGFIIADEGWQTAIDGKLTSFTANKTKFENGLLDTISECKQKYGLKEFFCWHTYNGYWKGVDGHSFPKYNVENRTFNIPERLATDPDHNTFNATAGEDFYPMNIAYQQSGICGDISSFYNDFYSELKKQGVDRTKIDAITWQEAFAQGKGGRVKAMDTLLRAIDGASCKYFGGELINCSSCSNDFFMNLGDGAVVRTSCDYMPNNPSSHAEHIRDNAFVGFWTQPIVIADWDMFESGSEWGYFHAVARAISGGPIYCTDKPQNVDFSLIKGLSCKNGDVKRCSKNAVPTAKCLFGAPKGQPFRVYNKTEYGYVLAVFGNENSALCNISVNEIHNLPKGEYAVYSSKQGFVGVVSENGNITCNVKEREAEVFTLAKIERGVAVIGMTEKINPSAYIESVNCTEGKVSAIGVESGKFAVYTKQDGYVEFEDSAEIEIETEKPVLSVKKGSNSKKFRKIKKSFKDFFRRDNLALYLLLLPTLVYIFIFNYIPLSGLLMAFKDHNSMLGVFGSPWTDMGGFKHFYRFITLPDFWNIIKNTLVLSVYSIVVNTILPIVLALFINEIRSKWFKKTVQTISYAPYFVSVVVVCGMLFSFANYDTGIINRIITFFGGEKIMAMQDAGLFPHLYVWSGVWQGLGWWAIIYVGTLANVDQCLHEAAIIDGAGRLKRMWHINLPTIIPMAVIMLILSIGSMLSVGFEKVYLMSTPGNLSVSRIISTYVYEVTFKTAFPQQHYSYATAIGLFNSVVNIILLCVANTISRKVGETSLW